MFVLNSATSLFGNESVKAFKGEVVIVTGGDSGFGNCRFEDATVVVTDIDAFRNGQLRFASIPCPICRR